MKIRTILVLAVGLATALVMGRVISAAHYSVWSDPVSAESIPGSSPEVNTPFGDGCPIEAPGGLALYIASNRSGLGNNDLWRFRRASVEDGWGEPEKLPAPVNSDTANDFCPTPVRGGGLFFVSDRTGPDTCGGPDIYYTRENRDGTWDEPRNLGCRINSPAAEWSPSYFEDENGSDVLYFASTRTGGFAPGGSDADIYYSLNFGPPELAPGVNSEFNDFRPNVHRTGREMVFDSDRPGNLGPAGTFDIWTASRESTADAWDAPFHLPAPINSPASESRASISSDGLRLYFGSTRAGDGTGGGSDIYVSSRRKLKGYEK